MCEDILNGLNSRSHKWRNPGLNYYSNGAAVRSCCKSSWHQSGCTVPCWVRASKCSTSTAFDVENLFSPLLDKYARRWIKEMKCNVSFLGCCHWAYRETFSFDSSHREASLTPRFCCGLQPKASVLTTFFSHSANVRVKDRKLFRICLKGFGHRFSPPFRNETVLLSRVRSLS